MKTVNAFLLEKAKTKTLKGDDSERKILKVKNKVIINPDFSSYQAKTHKDPDTSVPLDGLNTNGKATNSATAQSSGT